MARGGGGGAGNPVTVTLADQSKLEGTLIRRDDFLVVFTLADGTRKSIARNNGVAESGHQEIRKRRTSKWCCSSTMPENKKMHDITAYLWTIK